MATNITLYEIAASGGASVSPFVWRTKLSLARKGLRYRSCMLGLTEIASVFDGRFRTCPIADFGDFQLAESLAIADHLDRAYPELPAIFSCSAERAMMTYFDHWLTKSVILDAILPTYALDIHESAARRDRDYYRRSREPFFGRTLEQVVADRAERLPSVRRSLEPVRRTIVDKPFLGGAEPNFADMCMLGLFIFVGEIATLPLLTADDPLIAYADRGLKAFPEETATLELRLSGTSR